MVLLVQVAAVVQVGVLMVLLVLQAARLFLEHLELRVRVVFQGKGAVLQALQVHQVLLVHRVRQVFQVQAEHQQEQAVLVVLQGHQEQMEV
jgi:ABC-type sulfate transport system permease subunit